MHEPRVSRPFNEARTPRCARPRRSSKRFLRRVSWGTTHTERGVTPQVDDLLLLIGCPVSSTEGRVVVQAFVPAETRCHEALAPSPLSSGRSRPHLPDVFAQSGDCGGVPQPGGLLSAGQFIPHRSEGCKSEIRVPAGSGGAKSPCGSLRTAVFLLCPHVAERERASDSLVTLKEHQSHPRALLPHNLI